MIRHWLRSVLVCAALIGVVSCTSKGSGSTTSPTPTATTTFQGTIAGANSQTGTLTVTVQAQVAAARPGSALDVPFGNIADDTQQTVTLVRRLTRCVQNG